MITFNSKHFSLCSIIFPYGSKIFWMYQLCFHKFKGASVFVHSKYFCSNLLDSQESVYQSKNKTLFRQ